MGQIQKETGQVHPDQKSVSSISKQAVIRLKYEVCKNFKEKGVCKYGDRCLFAHGDHELIKRGSPKETPTALLEDSSNVQGLKKKDVGVQKETSSSNTGSQKAEHCLKEELDISSSSSRMLCEQTTQEYTKQLISLELNQSEDLQKMFEQSLIMKEQAIDLEKVCQKQQSGFEEISQRRQKFSQSAQEQYQPEQMNCEIKEQSPSHSLDNQIARAVIDSREIQNLQDQGENSTTLSSIQVNWQRAMSNLNNQNQEEENYSKDFENKDDFKDLLENLEIKNIDIKTSNELVSNGIENLNNISNKHLKINIFGQDFVSNNQNFDLQEKVYVENYQNFIGDARLIEEDKNNQFSVEIEKLLNDFEDEDANQELQEISKIQSNYFQIQKNSEKTVFGNNFSQIQETYEKEANLFEKAQNPRRLKIFEKITTSDEDDE